MMKRIDTDMQKNDLLFPTRREVLNELHKRDGLDSKLISEFNRLEAGYDGEELVFDYLNQFGQSDWVVCRNLWLDYYGEFEIDLLLITDSRIYTFEIKHFSGVYEFKNNQCLRNGQKIGHNAISQAQKSFINIQNLFERNGFQQSIHGTVIFTGKHFDVKVQDEIADLTILTINQLRDYIWKISNRETRGVPTNMDVDYILSLLNQYAVSNPFPPRVITPEMDTRMKKGILCSHCRKQITYSEKYYFDCSCGMSEPRENAIVRTICEYGMIHFDKELTTVPLVDFFNGELHIKTIRYYLKKYFGRSGTGRCTQYTNIRQSFWSNYHKFGFKKSRYYKC